MTPAAPSTSSSSTARSIPAAAPTFRKPSPFAGNQILRVGSNREVKRLRRAQTVVLDAHGATVLPGLNDARVQLMSGALTLEHLNLSPARTIGDIETELRHYAEDKPSTSWLLGRNGDADLLAAANAPARKILDEAVHDRPVLVTSEDGNVAWANSKALELAGITRKTRNPRSGIVVKDRRTGEPTGVLKDDAVDLVSQAGARTDASREAGGAAGGHRRSEQARHHERAFRQSDPRRARAARRNPARRASSRVRVYASIAVPPTVSEADVLELNKLRDEFPDDPALKLGGVMVMCPCDAPQIERAVALLDKHGWHVMVQTVNGADVHAAVNAFEHAAAANPAPARDRRNRLDESLLSDGQARILFGSNWPAAALDPRDAIEDAVAAPGRAAQCDRRVHEPRGVCVLRRAAQRHARARACSPTS